MQHAVIKLIESIPSAPTIAMVCLHSTGSELGGPSSGDLAALEWQHIKYHGVTAYHEGSQAHNIHRHAKHMHAAIGKLAVSVLLLQSILCFVWVCLGADLHRIKF